jgi:hypothetical protein
MDVIKNLKAILGELEYNQYAVKDIPAQLSVVDNNINEILDYCMSISQDERNQIHESITAEMAWLLLCFGIRMATYSLRLSNQKHFTHGLLSISMAFEILDTRELLVVLPLYCDVQKKNNLSFDEILKQNNGFTSVLENFINRDEKDNSLECMGYVLEIDENNTPTYQRTW